MWEWYKNPQDYSRFFREWWKKDLTDMILRDRNHPSIIMWSIGNEILEKSDTARLRIGKQLAGHVRNLDNTRAVTQAINGVFYPDGWESTAPMFELTDVCGYNYSPDKFIAVFEVSYEPGDLQAIVLENGRETARKVLKTAGKPVSLRLTADRSRKKAEPSDLSFVKIELVGR